MTPGRRFYIRNVLGELDSPGEWYLSKGTKTLYFYPPSGGAPAERQCDTRVSKQAFRSQCGLY